MSLAADNDKGSCHPCILDRDIVWAIIDTIFSLKHGVCTPENRILYIRHVTRYLTVCQTWRRILQTYIDSIMVIHIVQHSKLSLRKQIALKRKQVLELILQTPLIAKYRARTEKKGSGYFRADVKQKDKTMLHVCSNIPRLSADSVRTVVLILSGQLSENGAELGLLESGVWNKQWPTAKCLYVQNDITLRNGLRTEALGAHERAMQVVMNHVPNLDSFYLTRNRPDYEIADLTFGSAIAGNSPKLKRLEVYCDIRCSRVPFGLPKLTSLVMTIRPGCTVSWWIPCAASGTLQNMDLSNVETDLFLQMYRQNNGTVSFVNLKTLRLRQRTNLVMADNPARMRERQRAAVQEEAVVEFPQLQVARILGIQEHVPIGVFPALVRSAVKRLDINLGVRSGMQLRLGEMRHLKHLCASLPLISDVQSVVNDVLTSPMATLLTLHLRTNVLLECRIPTSFHMANLRILNLESFIPFEHVRLIIKFLPRLVFLKAGIVKDPEAESILTFAETEMIALAAYEPLETSLQVLKLWHCESLWAPGGFTSLRVAMIIGLLVSIPSLEQFSAPVDVPGMRAILDRVIRLMKEPAKVDHLRSLCIAGSNW